MKRVRIIRTFLCAARRGCLGRSFGRSIRGTGRLLEQRVTLNLKSKAPLLAKDARWGTQLLFTIAKLYHTSTRALKNSAAAGVRSALARTGGRGFRFLRLALRRGCPCRCRRIRGRRCSAFRASSRRGERRRGIPVRGTGVKLQTTRTVSCGVFAFAQQRNCAGGVVVAVDPFESGGSVSSTCMAGSLR